MVTSIATKNNSKWDKGYKHISYFGKKSKKKIYTVDNRNYTSLNNVNGFKYRYSAEKALTKVKAIFDEQNNKYKSWDSYFEVIEVK